MLCSDLRLDDRRLRELTLVDIDRMLRPNGHSLKDYLPLPIPNNLSIDILEKMIYNKDLLTEEYLSLRPKMTNEQLNIFNVIKDAVDNGTSGVFFVNGHGGIGKTFLWRVLTSALRSREDIVLAGKYFMNLFICYFMCHNL